MNKAKKASVVVFGGWSLATVVRLIKTRGESDPLPNGQLAAAVATGLALPVFCWWLAS